jgi:hypothetical protein
MKKVSRLSISVMSFAAMSAINYTIIHNPIVLLASFILLMHELGHYLMAKNFGANVKFPIFIPLIIMSIGITQVADLEDKHKSMVALAGPMMAGFFIIALILFNFTYKIFSTKILFLFLFGEIVFNYFGLDGKRYRNLNKIIYLFHFHNK